MGILDSLLEAMFMHKAQKEIDKDTEFKNRLKRHNEEIARLTKEIEELQESMKSDQAKQSLDELAKKREILDKSKKHKKASQS
ncbi:MAG: hypothetical protein ABSB78_13000 [Bacteroidota bacterium]